MSQAGPVVAQYLVYTDTLRNNRFMWQTLPQGTTVISNLQKNLPIRYNGDIPFLTSYIDLWFTN